MKIALITDTHYGIRSDNLSLLNHFKTFLDNVFFPYIDTEGIKTVIHLGDLVDRRKYININTAMRMRNDLIDPILQRDLDFHVLAGNHDVYFKNSNKVNSLDELLSTKKITTYIEPTEIMLGETSILLLPWIPPENEFQSLDMIKKTKAQICFGHLELLGFEQDKGSYSETGFESEIFSKFDIVCSGHFHHKSTYQNINYLGSPYQTTWADYNDVKGFHVFDTKTRNLEFIENPYKLFYKLFYDDENKTYEEVMSDDVSHLVGTYVKIIVKNKNNPFWFDQYIQKLEELPVVDVQSVDDHFNLNLESDDEIINQAESTLDILKSSIAQLNIKKEYEQPLEMLLSELYNQANLIQA